MRLYRFQTAEAVKRVERAFARLADEGRPAGFIEAVGENPDGTVVAEVEVEVGHSDDYTPEWEVIGRKLATDDTMTEGTTNLLFEEWGSNVSQLPAGMRCGRCGKKAGTLLLLRRIAEPHDVLQVGRHCLKEVTGYDFANETVLAESGAERIPANEGWTFGFAPVMIPLGTFLMAARDSIAETGYVKSAPDTSSTPQEIASMTKNAAWNLATERLISRKNHEESADELAYATKIREWATKKPATEFWDNARAVLAGTRLRDKMRGVAASLPKIYEGDKKREAERAKVAVNNIDDAFPEVEIGAKVTVDGVVERVGGYSTQFGFTNVLSVRGDDGFLYVWKTASNGLDVYQKVTRVDADGETERAWEDFVRQVGRGDRVRMSGKVKDKSEYKGVCQTSLTRAKVSIIAPLPEIVSFPFDDCRGETEVPDNTTANEFAKAIIAFVNDHEAEFENMDGTDVFKRAVDAVKARMNAETAHAATETPAA